MQQRSSTDDGTMMSSTSTYLSIWPVVLGKDRVIGVHCPVSDEHNGLAADASLSSVVSPGTLNLNKCSWCPEKL